MKTKIQEEHFMNRKEFLNGVIAALLFLVLVAAPPVLSKGSVEKSGNTQKLSKVQVNDFYRPMDINNIFNYYSNNGDGSFNKFTTSSEGFEFPIGSNDGTALFEDGLVWTAFKGGTLLCGGSTYNHGLQAGRILTNGTASSLPTADDPGKAEYRIYRVRPDMRPIAGVTDPGDAAAASEIGALRSEVTYISRFESYSAQQLLQQYWDDWNQWPASEGAPFTDANGVAHVSGGSGYDPATCTPGFPGADQTQWMVMNDVNTTKTQNLYSSDPIGIEVQRTIWAYNRPGALGNTIFISYKFVNKSGVRLDSMYVSQWADPDLGYAGDDAVGCDTTLSLGYVYNGVPRDANFANLGLPPPAVGFDFFQGPIVTGAAGDTAIFDLKYVSGKKNLPMTAFDFFINSNATFSDPNLHSNGPDGTPQWYNLMRGLISTSGAPFPASVTGGGTYCYPGDPVTGTGPTYIGPAQVSPPADVRMCLNSGPFTMAPGDTQEVVVAALVGLGGDYLSSISALKANDEIAQSAYNALFQLAVPPPQPYVHVAALDKEIILTWGDPNAPSHRTPADIEGSNSKGYTFEGYNIYQYPNNSPNGGKLLATYDLVDGIGTIQDTTFSVALGTNIVTPTEYGKNNGVRHAITITQDAFSGSTLVNNRDYYFAVTAYSYNPTAGLVPHALESAPDIKAVRPQSTQNGVRYNASPGDSLAVTHTGNSDGEVVASVTDPSVLTGHQYQVGFTIDTVSGNTYWKLTDVTANKVLASNQTQAAAGTTPAGVVVDGILVQTFGPPPGMKDWSVTGTRHWTFVNADWGAEGFNGAIGNAHDQWFSSSSTGYDKLKNVQIKFAITDTAGNFAASDPNASFGYRYLRRASQPPARPEFAPFIVNPGAGYAFQDYKKSMPLAAYDIEANPPRRLMVGYLENNAADGLVDGHYWPPYYGDPTYGDNIGSGGPREWLFIFDDTYSETPDAALETDILDNTLPIMWFATVTRRDAGAWTGTSSPSWTFTILANHINLPTDQFTFTSAAPTQTKANEIADVAKINVFPNPYFGFNKLETDKYSRFVRFTHLPQKATIRIYNLAGILVRTLQKNDATQYQDWDLLNEYQLPVAAGMYIAYIDMPDLGQTKTLKLAIIPEQQFLDHY
jgi:hypothetical protein